MAVDAAFNEPWPDNDESPISVFNTASNIRFYERRASLIRPRSETSSLLKHALRSLTSNPNSIRYGTMFPRPLPPPRSYPTCSISCSALGLCITMMI
ncbi:hypothetical protein F5146DRAFT_1038889 [Armillaria mellea]|nr:hypothetical protein F5146DRAFT_1038889 [Armillaria mellea]